jgi:hypothetical protein
MKTASVSPRESASYVQVSLAFDDSKGCEDRPAIDPNPLRGAASSHRVAGVTIARWASTGHEQARRSADPARIGYFQGSARESWQGVWTAHSDAVAMSPRKTINSSGGLVIIIRRGHVIVAGLNRGVDRRLSRLIHLRRAPRYDGLRDRGRWQRRAAVDGYGWRRGAVVSRVTRRGRVQASAIVQILGAGWNPTLGRTVRRPVDPISPPRR